MEVVFSLMGSLSLDNYHFLFLDEVERNANISVSITPGSTVRIGRLSIIHKCNCAAVFLRGHAYFCHK